MARYDSLKELYYTRLREFYRQPARIFWVYGFPLVLAVLLGLAFRSRPQEAVQVDLVENASADAAKRALDAYIPKAKAAGRPRPALTLLPAKEAEVRLKTGKSALMVEVATSGEVTYHFDPTRPEAITAKFAFDDAYQRALGRADPAATRDTLVTEPGSRYIDFLIPGLIGLNTMGGGLWGIGFLLVHFRIAKLLKRFQATPMPRENFLLALLGARLTFLVPDMGILLALGVWGFGMPIRGNFGLVVLITVLGALAFAGIGLLVASRRQTTEAVSGLMNLVMLPMWIFSGVFFKSDFFPGYMQWFIQALPLTQLVDALRRVMLQGAGVLDVWPALAILSAWAVVTFAIALRIFRWS